MPAVRQAKLKEAWNQQVDQGEILVRIKGMVLNLLLLRVAVLLQYSDSTYQI
jgi:hypothetical protein